FTVSESLDEIEDEIDAHQVFLSSLPRFHPRRAEELRSLTGWRYRHFEISALYGQLDQLILHLTEALLLQGTGSTPATALSLYMLAKFLYVRWKTFKQPDDIKYFLKYCRQLVNSLRRDPSSNHLPIPSLPFNTLRDILVHTFDSTDKIEFLDESIAVLRDGLKMHCTPYEQQFLTISLIPLLSSRLDRLERREDLEDLIQLFVKLVDDTAVTASMQLMFSRSWAVTAHSFGHPSITTAYEKALSLTQDYYSYPPTLETQHFRLVSMREDVADLPSNYASYQVDTGQLNRAIETLERGRALLWSEMRSFRTSADRLAAGPSRVDPFGPLVAKRQELLEDREKLIERIRALPDLHNFLKPPSFEALRSAALRGPVVTINHCKFRSDILILFHNSPPSLITTPDDFHDRALELGDRLVEDRKVYGLESRRYNRTLRFVLERLYGLVGRPVIEEFRKMKVPEHSRVWWCPTSVFCHLPLHAMGPIPSDDRVKRYFSDLYITSYTPTLSTLIESRKPGRQSPGRPSILLVAQPESLQYAIPEIWKIQRLDATVTSLISKKATPSSVVEGLRHHQFSHFVCHGNLERGRPLDASFQLYGSERLTLLDIVRSRLPRAEFAFLSACHTAELTEDSIDDEALHLTAAMQYCGFRSVVGTMWAMADEDGQYLVEDFYKSILSRDEPGVAYYERSARALRDAVQNLRRKGVPLERWVNYVHYGV
ncbi:CHAT domain-containing protein, partial [Lactifluus volemus]